jgi:hypothetical protein
MSQQPPEPIRSQDGRWEWDGQAWRPVTPIASVSSRAGEPPPPPWAAQTQPAARGGGGQAVASLVLGILSLVAWLLPIAGIPIAGIGLLLGILGVTRGSRRGMAVAGIVLSAIGLLLSVINAAIGAYLGATGQLRTFG